MRTMPSRRSHRLLIALIALALVAGGCGGDDGGAGRDQGGKTDEHLTVWILENQPERVRATKANVARFTRQTGIGVRVVAIPDDGLPPAVRRARAGNRMPDAVQLPLDSVHAYAQEGLLDSAAAEEVVERLGDSTFSQTALRLVSRDGRIAAVPSDGWGQLLIYRRDLFDQAGLSPPATLEDVRRAARRLDRDGLAGITLATTPDGFTAETFEHVALISGCQLVDDTGHVSLASPRCRRAMRVYVDLTRSSPGGVQDVDTTLKAYFAGKAAMIFWSPFLLDAMAGLRNEAAPTCPQCRSDPAFLAKNSGLVGALSSDDRPAAQFGSISSWGIPTGDRVDGGKRFVEYMMSDGYMRWLALSPQGKYPVRLGDTADPDRFAREWGSLSSGVDRRAPLRRFYSAATIEALGTGVRMFQRWGFEQGQAALLGELRGPQPVTRALGKAIRGEETPATAAREAQAAVEKLQSRVK
jgi:multiple sugar transport system substrate-binding protein